MGAALGQGTAAIRGHKQEVMVRKGQSAEHSDKIVVVIGAAIGQGAGVI